MNDAGYLRKYVKSNIILIFGSTIFYFLMILDLILFSIFTGEHTRLHQDRCAEDVLRTSVFWIETTIYCYQSNGCLFFRPTYIGFITLILFSIFFSLGLGLTVGKYKDWDMKTNRTNFIINQYTVLLVILLLYTIIIGGYINKSNLSSRLVTWDDIYGLFIFIIYPAILGLISFNIGKKPFKRAKYGSILIILLIVYIILIILKSILIIALCTT
ncbi:MAG: hypothetical protein HeimC3_17300 [Candidatus Heimdallarchaeota archaeon LC_3]|nr:MAG: hypothetical protein HeimC3_17300 [Candidatus Heimdallarchaeota archaeon LC_3]